MNSIDTSVPIHPREHTNMEVHVSIEPPSSKPISKTAIARQQAEQRRREKHRKSALEKLALLGTSFSNHPLRNLLDRCNALQRLRQEPQPVQRSPEWYEMRNSMLTASDFYKALSTPRAKESWAQQKSATNTTQTAFSSASCNHGIKYEECCRKIYEMLNNVQVEEFGCIRHPSIPYLGASPDGICNEHCDEYVARAVEFKAPFSRKIVSGEVPRKYAIQVQGQLEVLDLDICDYFAVSYTHLTLPTKA